MDHLPGLCWKLKDGRRKGWRKQRKWQLALRSTTRKGRTSFPGLQRRRLLINSIGVALRSIWQCQKCWHRSTSESRRSNNENFTKSSYTLLAFPNTGTSRGPFSLVAKRRERRPLLDTTHTAQSSGSSVANSVQN